MDCLFYECASFSTDSFIGQLCVDLNKISGRGIYYDTIDIQNTKLLWFVNNIMATINSNKVLWGSFGTYPSYVAGILNSVNNLHFHVSHGEKLNYADYVEKRIAGKERNFKLPTD